MAVIYLLVYVPVVLFVLAFLYETYLSIARLRHGKERRHYVESTWEITHTILIFAIVMMLMLFTQSIDQVAENLFWPAFLAITFLMIRGASYVQIFYIRKDRKRRNWIDWVFMLAHIGAAITLVWAVLAFTVLALSGELIVNQQFVPAFLLGLVIVLACIAIPMLYLYFVNRADETDK